MPLFRSTRAAKSSNVSGVSALIVKSDMLGNVPGIADVRRPVAHAARAAYAPSRRGEPGIQIGARTGTLIGMRGRTRQPALG